MMNEDEHTEIDASTTENEMARRHAIAKRLDDATKDFLNEVKAEICAAVICKQDLSLGTIGEIASLLGLEAVVAILDKTGKT